MSSTPTMEKSSGQVSPLPCRWLVRPRARRSLAAKTAVKPDGSSSPAASAAASAVQAEHDTTGRRGSPSRAMVSS
jgi:hypothetical protein